jgi:hypothetical protein
MVKLSRQEALAELGVAAAAGDAEVRSAYKRLAREWHPDKNPSEGATEKFQRINAAYHRLTQGSLDDKGGDADDLDEEDIFEFFETFFFRGRTPWAKGSRQGRNGCPCGRPGCMGFAPPPAFVFSFGPRGRGGAGHSAGARAGWDEYDDEYSDDDFDEEDREFYDWYPPRRAA